MISVNNIKIVPTIFPDKTSQVWKLPQEVFDYVDNNQNIYIKWDFESESELMHVLQLAELIHIHISKSGRYDNLDTIPNLILKMDYLPYARQDKEVDNNLTFALHVFLGVLASNFHKIEVFDPHNLKMMEEMSNFVNIITAEDAINKAIFVDRSNVICYPDKGAKERYENLNISKLPSVYMEKVRDQMTGNVLGIKLSDDTDLNILRDQRVIIIDDICDGGRTFIEAAKVLYSNLASTVSLYTSHGIYSKGLKVLLDAGIDRVYDKNGLVTCQPL